MENTKYLVLQYPFQSRSSEGTLVTYWLNYNKLHPASGYLLPLLLNLRDLGRLYKIAGSCLQVHKSQITINFRYFLAGFNKTTNPTKLATLEVYAMYSAYRNRIGKFLPGEPINNDEMEEYLGKMTSRPSRVSQRILNSNGIQKRYYAIDKQQPTLYSNSQMPAFAVRAAISQSNLQPGA